MKIVFFGTPEYSKDVLSALYKEFLTQNEETPIAAVVTQEPKPTGRNKMLAYSPVDTWAHKRNIPIYFDVRKLMKDGVQADLGVLASYGKILPDEALIYFKHGILNIHPSLLPIFRGASPVQATLVTGESAGSTIIRLDDKMDHGPIVTQLSEDVKKLDTTESLRNRLFERSTQALIEAIPAYVQGKINLRKQDDNSATFTTLIKKRDGYVPFEFLMSAIEGKESGEKWNIPFIKDFSLTPSPMSLERFIRAMRPWPITWTTIRGVDERLEGKRLQILSASIIKDKLVPKKVQLEGKNEVTWDQFLEAYKF